jgi:hypothetical protein
MPAVCSLQLLLLKQPPFFLLSLLLCSQGFLLSFDSRCLGLLLEFLPGKLGFEDCLSFCFQGGVLVTTCTSSAAGMVMADFPCGRYSFDSRR